MIRYRLQCSAGHAFESWFRDSAAYDDQRARSLVTCPSCGVAEVEKALMAPALGRGGKAATSEPPAEDTAAERPSAGKAPMPERPVALISDKDQEMRAMLRALRDHVVRNSDYVGSEFATLARRMHEGDVERRSIHGEASEADVRALLEDEIEVHPLPGLPEDRN